MNYVKVKALRGGGYWLVAANDRRLGTEFEPWVEPDPVPELAPEPDPDPDPGPVPGNDISAYDIPKRSHHKRGK